MINRVEALTTVKIDKIYHKGTILKDKEINPKVIDELNAKTGTLRGWEEPVDVPSKLEKEAKNEKPVESKPDLTNTVEFISKPEEETTKRTRRSGRNVPK